MRRLAALLTVALALLPISHASALALVSPDVEFTEDEPALATVNTSMLTLDFIEVSETGGVAGAQLSKPSTCDLKNAQTASLTRNRTTKVVTGDFTMAATTKCSNAVALYAVATLQRGSTAVKSTSPGTCNASSSGTPCTAVTTNDSYHCAACAAGSWSTRSTHRITIPLNTFPVNMPDSCTQLTPTVIECVLTSSKTTIK
jgi:hypothetical protein